MDVTLRDLAPGDAGWLIQRHAELYARSDGFDATFEALVARILADFIEHRDRAVDRGWIAQGAEGVRLGSIFCVRRDGATAQLRLFFVEPEARGSGLGTRLLRACLDHARAHGFERLALWTHESHEAACRLYARTGFVLEGSRAKTQFGQDLVEQSWSFDLTRHAPTDGRPLAMAPRQS